MHVYIYLYIYTSLTLARFIVTAAEDAAGLISPAMAPKYLLKDGTSAGLNNTVHREDRGLAPPSAAAAKQKRSVPKLMLSEEEGEIKSRSETHMYACAHTNTQKRRITAK